jgi:hypothetical protein
VKRWKNQIAAALTRCLRAGVRLAMVEFVISDTGSCTHYAPSAYRLQQGGDSIVPVEMPSMPDR